MGDGQTAFTNYIYNHIAGFSEFDDFRSSQIRDGLITREEAIDLIEKDNTIFSLRGKILELNDILSLSEEKQITQQSKILTLEKEISSV